MNVKFCNLCGAPAEFRVPEGGSAFWPVIAATTLAFFAMVGFEDSVNMAEECKDPSRIFPKVLLAGLVITGVIYVLVSIAAITLVTSDARTTSTGIHRVLMGVPWRG